MVFRSFLEYYEDEMNYLVESGKELKNMYPSISNFDFSEESSDPDVKRLIEGTAFLNANLQKRIDEKNIELSQEILNSIYPYFNRPTPSFCVFEMSGLQTRMAVPKLTKIQSVNSYNSDYLHFLTCHRVETSAFDIVNIEKINSNGLPRYISKLTDTVISISIRKIFDTPEKEMIFFINRMDHSAALLYEALFSFYVDKKTPVFENEELIGEIDFYDDFTIFPQLRHENSSFAPAIEFNLIKEKFFFFKITLFKEPSKNLHIPIKSKNDLNITKKSFLLNCAVGINLFEKTSDPVHVDHRKHRHKILIKPSEDIYTIYQLQNAQNPQQKFIQYFSLDFEHKTKNDILWYYKKDHNIDSCTFLYLFEENFESKIVYAKMLCTQKHVNELVSFNDSWTIPNFNISCVNLKKPTKYQSQSNFLPAQRKIISLINLNYYGLENNEILKNLKAIFRLFNHNQELFPMLNNIIDISFETKMVPMKSLMIPKIFITIKAEYHPFAFLLARVISKLIESTITMNKKIGVILVNNENNSIWKEWDVK